MHKVKLTYKVLADKALQQVVRDFGKAA